MYKSTRQDWRKLHTQNLQVFGYVYEITMA